MKPSIIVWDLETVPDLAGFAAVHDLVGKSDVEVREAIDELWLSCCCRFFFGGSLLTYRNKAGTLTRSP